MGEVVHIHSSQSTLEQIAERDNVDEAFRRRYLKNEIIGYSIMGSLGVAGIVFSLYNMIKNEEFSFWWSLLTAGGGLFGIGGISNVIGNVNVRKQYLQQLSVPNVEYPQGFFYLNDSISKEQTAVEAAYGHEIHATVIPSKIGDHREVPKDHYQFIDHVIVRDVHKSQRDEENIEFDGEVGHYRTVTTFHDINFTLQRYNRMKQFSFTFKGSIDGDISRLANRQDEKLALVINPRPTDYSYQQKPFEVKAIYKHEELG